MDVWTSQTTNDKHEITFNGVLLMQRRILGMYWRTAYSHKKLFWLATISIPFNIIIERYLSPLAIAAIFAMVQDGSVTIQSATWLIVAYAIAQIYTQILGYRITLFAYWRLSTLGTKELSNMTFDVLMKKSARFYANEFQGALIARAGRFASAFDTFWSSFIYQVLFLGTTIIATMIAVGFISIGYMLVLLLLAVLFMIAAYIGNKSMRPLFEKKSEVTSEVTAQFSDAVSNIMAVKAEANAYNEIQRTALVNSKWEKADASAMNAFLKFSSLFASFIAAMKIAAIIAAVLLVQSHNVNAGVVYLLITYTVNLIEEIWNFNNFFRNYTRVLADAREMIEIIDQPDEVIDASSNSIDIQKGSIEFKKVHFDHSNLDNGLFKDFNLSIKPGEKIGLVGRSGSGKTTLVNLLLRFMDIDKGSIEIDRQNIANFNQESLRSAISYVSQEPLLFHRSLRENISYSRPLASDEEIVSAAKKAYAWKFIKDLPDGLDTLVGERGVKLSGGQRQRVAIARAILKDAPILILDEATSALDSESEKLIQEALTNLMKDRTSIVIAHRLSTIAELDRIIVLDNGRIIEDGSHGKLLQENGVYAKLWSHQSGGFIED